jgi:choline dehydrogenase-like flavoprotein
MHAHATHIQLASSTDRVMQIEVSTSPDRTFTVEARHYVLACGGLENARLLLASRDLEPSGVGNRHGNVGRYYMSHMAGVIATIKLHDAERGFVYNYERDSQGVYCRRRLWVTPEAQLRTGTANGIGLLHQQAVEAVDHRNALFSASFLAKSYITAFKRRSLGEAVQVLRSDRSARRGHWLVVLRNLHLLVPEAARFGQRRWLARRRIPSLLGKPSGGQFDLLYNTEHTPNRDSRVELDSERDAFGIPRLTAHVAFSPLDFETVMQFHEQVARRLEVSGVGRLIYKREDVRAHLAEQVDYFNTKAHHIGTTRMSLRPEDGVVDANSRVHGIDNLYVTGSSVFPTSGHANPTLTIVALAVRLAAHLRNRVQVDDVAAKVAAR